MVEGCLGPEGLPSEIQAETVPQGPVSERWVSRESWAQSLLVIVKQIYTVHIYIYGIYKIKNFFFFFKSDKKTTTSF